MMVQQKLVLHLVITKALIQQPTTHTHTDHFEFDFVATSTTVEFLHNATIPNFQVQGNGTLSQTWTEIVEIPDIVETTDY